MAPTASPFQPVCPTPCSETVPNLYMPTTPAQVVFGTPPGNLPNQNFGLLADGGSSCDLSQTGGSPTGKGSETTIAQAPGILLKEGDSFTASLEHDFVVPASPAFLTVTYANLSFDTTAVGQIKDAFEMDLVNASNQPLVEPYAADRDAFFNISEGQPAALGSGVTVNGTNVTVDISGLTPGTTARLILRLDNNDGDHNTNVEAGSMSLSEIPSYGYRVPGPVGSTTDVTFTATGTASTALSDELGFAEVSNLLGSVNGLLPGQPGYAQAVLPGHATGPVRPADSGW